MKRLKAIKPFKTLEEEANFWGTHDVSGIFKNPKAELKTLPLLESEKEEVLTLRIQKPVKANINRIARLKGLNPSTLARMWLIERLQMSPK